MALEPITRAEQIMSGEGLTPITREEMFLAKAAGQDVETPTPITRREMFLSQISGGGSGGGGAASVSEKDVNFYDYDGTCLYAYTVAEAQALSELPALPEQPGLICQGWNWSLEDIKAHNRAVNVGATYTTDDGTTRIYIHLDEGRTAPMLGVQVGRRSTVTVDWGDGTEPDVLVNTGTYATNCYTPNHEYNESGDYVIRLTVNGTMQFNTGSSAAIIVCYNKGANFTDKGYNLSVRKVEIGSGVDQIYDGGFSGCRLLKHITIPNNVTYIGSSSFYGDVSLEHIVIPNSVTGIGRSAFYGCQLLSCICIPNGVATIGDNAFFDTAIRDISFPKACADVYFNVCTNCDRLQSVAFGENTTAIGSNAFSYCYSLLKVAFPPTALTIAGFNYCSGVICYDFTRHTAVPTLSASNAFYGIAEYCEIRVPVALYDEWIAATNWSKYAEYIVAV